MSMMTAPSKNIVFTLAITAAASLAIFTLSTLGSSITPVYAPPIHCILCSTAIEGNGTGTITIPDNPNAEIAPAFCHGCDAEISFEAFEDIKGTAGQIQITFIDNDGAEQVIQGNVSQLKTNNDGTRFSLRGELTESSIPGWDPNQTFVLTAEMDTESGEWTIKLKEQNGIKGTFTGDDVVVSIIGPD